MHVKARTVNCCRLRALRLQYCLRRALSSRRSGVVSVRGLGRALRTASRQPLSRALGLRFKRRWRQHPASALLATEGTRGVSATPKSSRGSAPWVAWASMERKGCRDGSLCTSVRMVACTIRLRRPPSAHPAHTGEAGANQPPGKRTVRTRPRPVQSIPRLARVPCQEAPGQGMTSALGELRQNCTRQRSARCQQPLCRRRG